MAEQHDKPRVVITRAIPGTPEVSGAELSVLGRALVPREQVLAGIQGASGIVTMFHDRVDAEFLEAAGPGLKVVANFAVGYDNIDLPLCKERGVEVANTPDAVTEGTSNMAWLMIMACARRLIEADLFARSAAYPEGGPQGMGDFLGKDLLGKRLLIVGAGRIGLATALKSVPWSMEVGYVARGKKPALEGEPLNASRFELLEGLAWADVVSVHLPLTRETRGLFDAAAFGKMKPGSIFVNTGRGPIHVESALADALESGHLFGAGLDVFEREPAINPRLLGRTDVVLTPHIGSAEARFRSQMTDMVCASVAAGLRGEKPPRALW